MLNKIKEILVEELFVEEEDINLNAHLQNDLLLDDLDILNLITELEDQFEISISADVIVNFETLQDIVNYLEVHV